MRQYSRRERILFAVLGIFVFAPVTALGAFAYWPHREYWSFGVLLGFLGGLGATIICLMIAVRGRSTSFLERDVIPREEEQ